MMTRKDYVVTAEILHSYLDYFEATTFDNIVEDFAQMFREDNERFITEKFVDACWGGRDE